MPGPGGSLTNDTTRVRLDEGLAAGYRFIDFNLNQTVADTVIPEVAGLTILMVKVLRQDANDDVCSIKIGGADKNAIKLSKLTRPDSDVIFQGRATNSSIHISTTASTAGGKLYLLVLVE